MKEKLCSSCGLCMIRKWPTQETIQSCVFKTGWLGTHEIDLYGRERSIENSDEMGFGICKDRPVGCIKNPIPGDAWSGVKNAARNIVDQMRLDSNAKRKPGGKFLSGLEESLQLL